MLEDEDAGATDAEKDVVEDGVVVGLDVLWSADVVGMVNRELDVDGTGGEVDAVLTAETVDVVGAVPDELLDIVVVDVADVILGVVVAVGTAVEDGDGRLLGTVDARDDEEGDGEDNKFDTPDVDNDTVNGAVVEGDVELVEIGEDDEDAKAVDGDEAVAEAADVDVVLVADPVVWTDTVVAILGAVLLDEVITEDDVVDWVLEVEVVVGLAVVDELEAVEELVVLDDVDDEADDDELDGANDVVRPAVDVDDVDESVLLVVVGAADDVDPADDVLVVPEKNTNFPTDA